jgi:hypothetical protein
VKQCPPWHVTAAVLDTNVFFERVVVQTPKEPPYEILSNNFAEPFGKCLLSQSPAPRIRRSGQNAFATQEMELTAGRISTKPSAGTPSVTTAEQHQLQAPNGPPQLPPNPDE